MKERWTGLATEVDRPGILYLERALCDFEGLSLELFNEDKSLSIQVFFEHLIFSYRITDEGRRMDTTNQIIMEYGEEFFPKYWLFSVENSEYLEWIHKETYSCYAKIGLKHYVIVTLEDYVDVICMSPPQIKVLHSK